jgi:hypothetical protein
MRAVARNRNDVHLQDWHLPRLVVITVIMR